VSYRLDFTGGHELRVLAGLLAGQRVLATGELHGDHLRLSKLKADPAAAPADAVAVDATGKPRWRIYDAVSGETLVICDTLPSPFSKSWGQSRVLVVAGQTFPLNFSNRTARARADQLGGQEVRVTGTLRGGAVTADTVEAADSSYVKKTVQVEIRGALERHESLLQLAIWPPRPSYVWQVRAEGQTYTLTFADKSAQRLAQELLGRTVIVRGTLEGGVVTVTGLGPAPAA
jgi:hypothetical protein